MHAQSEYAKPNPCLLSITQGIPLNHNNRNIRGPLLILCLPSKDDDDDGEEEDESYMDAEIQDISRLIDGVCFLSKTQAALSFILRGFAVPEQYLNQGKFRKTFYND